MPFGAHDLAAHRLGGRDMATHPKAKKRAPLVGGPFLV